MSQDDQTLDNQTLDNQSQDVAELLSRYSRVIEDGVLSKELVDGYNTLRLADAALDKQALNSNHPEHPLQVVIIGPTQAGKSTLCNVLLDTNAAGISALAGYTVHAQGFASNLLPDELTSLEDLMLPLQRVALQDLTEDQLEQYVLEPVTPGPNALVDKAVVWDSPDFDSIESSGYRGAVLQSAAMADVLILMVSKDKYADKTVWDMLELISRLGKPLFVCINKLDAHDEATVVNSFQQRHQEQLGTSAPQIVSIPFIRNDTNGQTINPDNTIFINPDTRLKFQNALNTVQNSVDRTGQNKHINGFIEHHWQQWMAPIERERDALQNWNDAVSEAIANAKERYETRYLNNPEKYETFNKAIVELLTLLEIPGLASTLSKTRNIVTWPARKLFGIGRDVVRSGRDKQPDDQELEILNLILEQTLTSLQGHILTEQQESDSNSAYWSSMQNALQRLKPDIKQQYSNRAEQLQTEFEPKIEEAAQQLYGQLQQQPALLNTLRAARVSTDAAAVVLAVKSGGLAAADLIIAPAMLSVTTLLTESVLGQYMDRSKKQLIEQQKNMMNDQLLDKTLGEKLFTLGSNLNNDSLLLRGHELLPELSRNSSLS